MKIGDRVVVIKHRIPTPDLVPLIEDGLIKYSDYYGLEGTIIRNWKDESCYKQQGYLVHLGRLDRIEEQVSFCYDELEVIKYHHVYRKINNIPIVFLFNDEDKRCKKNEQR